MPQFEEENDLGRGGGEVDEKTLEEAWKRREALIGYEDPVRDAEIDEEIERRS